MSRIFVIVILLSLSGCSEVNYFEEFSTIEELTEEVSTYATVETEDITTTETGDGMFPASVYEYNVEDTILVPH